MTRPSRERSPLATVGMRSSRTGTDLPAFVDVDERFERQPSDLAFHAVGVDVGEERVERRRVGGQVETDRRADWGGRLLLGGTTGKRKYDKKDAEKAVGYHE